MVTPHRIALVLGGGNALGSYQAGVYQALHERGVEPDWVIGTSVGAVNGALIAGNAVQDRVAQLSAFWQPGKEQASVDWWPSSNETVRRTSAAITTIVSGRSGLFNALGPLGSWWGSDAEAMPSLYDSRPLAATLERLANFDRLNAEGPRFTACAVDLESGAERMFDSERERITPDHIRASAALLPTFPPIAINGRLMVDGGLSANLPLDPVLEEICAVPTLCIAVDLVPLAAAKPSTLGEAAGRAQELIFAAQSRRTIDRWINAYAYDPRFASNSITLVRLTYADQIHEVVAKGMDFSPESVRYRWVAGHREATIMLNRLHGNDNIGQAGLTVSGDLSA